MSDELAVLRADSSDPLFDREGMFHKRFPSDYRQVRYFALLIIQKAPPEIKEVNLLEQQVCELLRNAIKHGNKEIAERRLFRAGNVLAGLDLPAGTTGEDDREIAGVVAVPIRHARAVEDHAVIKHG